MSVNNYEIMFKEIVKQYETVLYAKGSVSPFVHYNNAKVCLANFDDYPVTDSQSIEYLYQQLLSQKVSHIQVALHILLHHNLSEKSEDILKDILTTKNPLINMWMRQSIWEKLPVQSIDLQWLNYPHQLKLPYIRAMAYINHPELDKIITYIFQDSDTLARENLISAIGQKPNHQEWLTNFLHQKSNNSMDEHALAGYYLACFGNSLGLTYLTEQLHQGDEHIVATIGYYLALLAHPIVIAPINILFSSSNSSILAKTLDMACYIASPKIIEGLIQTSYSHAVHDMFGISIGDEAIRSLKWILGEHYLPALEDYIFGYIPEKYTPEYQKMIAQQARESIPHLNKEQRYRYGQPLTISTLVLDLLSPHQGIANCAISQLQAIMKKDFGYRRDGDIFANLHAIEQWLTFSQNLLPHEQARTWLF